jgi:N-acetylmuramoyl-L-alanine amidase
MMASQKTKVTYKKTRRQNCDKINKIIALLILFILSSFFASSTEAGIVEIYFSANNVRYTLYTLHDGQLGYVQLNKISQMFRFSEEVDPVDGRVVLRYNDKSASFFPGQDTVIANRRSHFLEVPPRKIEGVIMIPLEFLTKILPLIYDEEIVWDSATRTLRVGVQNLEIYNLYTTPFGKYTQIVVELNQAASYKVTEKLPSLLIFELPHSSFTLPENPLQVNSQSVQHVKVTNSFGSTQIIVRLGAEFEQYKHSVTEDPARLLIDVYNTLDIPVETPEIPETPETPEIPETPETEGITEKDLIQEGDVEIPTIPREFSLRTIVIDPGHGGSDPGITISPQTDDTPGVYEKDITLTIAKMLATSLGQRFGGVRVVLTREGDSFVAAERATIANHNRADVFISLHVNNAPSQALSGFEVYIMDYGSLNLPEGFEALSEQSQVLDYAQAKYIAISERLAQQILSGYDALNIGGGTLKSAPLFTLKGATMPAVHIEIGYSSNSQDQAKILQEEFQQLLVSAITGGIAAFKKQEEQ